MTKKQITWIILSAFFIGGIGGVFMGRFFIPYIASVTGISSLNKLVTTSPIVVTRTQEVQLNEGVNIIDLVKQAGNSTVSIYDPANNFLGNGVIVSSDGLIFTSNTILGKQTSVTVVTNDGQILLLNLHVSTSGADPVTFPTSETGLPDPYARLLFRMSSQLPARLVTVAQEKYHTVSLESRGFMFNAQAPEIVDFFDIGTRASQLR